jgi:hypothetical protein
MRASHGYRLPTRHSQQRRPAGVAILAIVGVLASLLMMAFTLIRLWLLVSASAQPSRQLAALGFAVVLALVLIWVNWGVWEMIRWAWWANLALTILSSLGLLVAMRYVPDIAEFLARLRPGLKASALTGNVTLALLVALVYHLLAVVYMISAHTTFGVGVKDERPAWQRAQRR